MNRPGKLLRAGPQPDNGTQRGSAVLTCRPARPRRPPNSPCTEADRPVRDRRSAGRDSAPARRGLRRGPVMTLQLSEPKE